MHGFGSTFVLTILDFIDPDDEILYFLFIPETGLLQLGIFIFQFVILVRKLLIF